MRIDINICTKDRHSELALLLQSLRTQGFQDFDIQIVDGSQTPVISNLFLAHILNRLKLEGHNILIEREIIPGVCEARNQCFNLGTNPFILRIDDDSICEKDYIQKLVNGILISDNIGAIGGIVPIMLNSNFKRNPILYSKLSEIILNEDGDIVELGDDLGFEYLESNSYLEADHLRSSFLFKRKVANEIINEYGALYDTAYGLSGFREETDLSLKIKMKGYDLMVDTNAICWHLHCPSGGVRAEDYNQRVMSGDVRLKKQIKKWSKDGKLKLKIKTKK